MSTEAQPARTFLHRLSAVVLLLTVTTGCYNTFQLAPQELYKLDGYNDRGTVHLTSLDGDDVEVGPKTKLSLYAASGQEQTAAYSSVRINGNTMAARLRSTGAPVEIDLAQVIDVEARNFSVGKTVGLSVGIGGALLVGVIVLAVVLSAQAYDPFYDGFRR